MSSGLTGLFDKMPMTATGKAKLEADLKNLLQVERPAIIKAIEEAREQGDISENAEYEAAKERQGMIEARIADLQGKIATSHVIIPSEIKSDRIVFGATVRILDVEENQESNYQIVGVDEADVKSGKISVLSPIARALIGKQVGEVVVVQSPKGDRDYEIVSFEFK